MKTFHSSLFTSHEIYTAASRIDTIVTNAIATDPFIVLILPKFRIFINLIALALGRTVNSVYVKLLSAMDQVRDQRYISLRDYCKGFMADIDPEKAAAAKVINDIFQELGWSMHLEGYVTETSLLNALIIRLETAPVNAAIATLEATSKVADLKTAHQDFEVTFNQKIDGKTQEEYPKIRKCRIDIARYQAAILNYVDIMSEMQGGAFSTAAVKIDELIVEFESIARNRITRNIEENKITS